MRVVGIGSHCDLGDLYVRLIERGHTVTVHVGDADSADIMLGLVPRGESVQADLDACAAESGLVIFEGTGEGARQDALRRAGYRVVGGSALGDSLELDRAYGQRVLGDVGLQVASVHEVHGWNAAIAYVLAHPRRYVLKFSGSGFSSTRTYVGVMNDGADVLSALRTQRRTWAEPEEPDLILMDHLEGVEVGVGAYFNGTRFLRPANLDWEHKRFFPGDVGELTGEMGTVVTYRGADKLFDATLRRLEPLFRETRHVGYVNLNLIVNDDGIFPLEFTCRFGYPGFAILSPLQAEPWDRLLTRLAAGDGEDLMTHDGYAVGVVITVPPYPYPDGYARLSKGMPVCFAPMSAADRAALHYGEVRRQGEDLVTAGQVGYVMVVTGTGAEVLAARDAALARVRKVVVPNMRYRNDIGDKLVRQDLAILARLGWLT